MKKLLLVAVAVLIVFISKFSLEVNETEFVEPIKQPEAISAPISSAPRFSGKEQAVTEPTPVEQQKLYQNLEQLFVERLPTLADPRQLRSQLSAINAQGIEAVELMFAGLQSPKTPVTTRLAIVDYLRYRLRWDDQLKEMVLRYIDQKIATDSHQFKALVMADKAELLGSIAKSDRMLARQVAETIGQPLFRNIVSYEIYHALLEDGETSESAQRFVRSFHRGFKL